MKIDTCFWLAWIEWSRSLFKRESPGTYRYDFFWLTILLVLISVMGLFLWSSKQGVLNKCMDVFLGNVPNYGVPIWLEAQLSPVGGRHLIGREVLKKISDLRISSLEAHPYKEVEEIYVKLPDYNVPGMSQYKSKEPIWRDKQSPDKNVEFNARAVYPQDPLWIVSRKKKERVLNLPLEVTLDRSLFKKYFDCDVYRQSIDSSVPENLLGGMPEIRESDSLWCLR
ncbi:MAG: hypothetical protein GY749_43085 [Desulfobacteraceae bacterium]|nr:hypothetical protein [Desulfobacteraceae bacterium]